MRKLEYSKNLIRVKQTFDISYGGARRMSPENKVQSPFR